MANTDNGPGPFDPTLLAAFARVIIAWSYVEQLQGQLLSFLLKAEGGRVFVITQNVSASTVKDWIRVLLQIPSVQLTGIGDLSERSPVIFPRSARRLRSTAAIRCAP